MRFTPSFNAASRWSLVVAALGLLFIGLWAAPAFAQVYDFEDGTDGQVVVSPIPGMEFTPMAGHQWLYGDWRAPGPGGDPKYNGPYPDGAFYSYDNFFAFVGPDQDVGTITFTGDPVGYFAVEYSAAGAFTLKAYNASAVMIDQAVGDVNTMTGQMDLLEVEGEIAWVEMGFIGNHWIIDNVSTEYIPICTQDSDCDDGVFCNGPEACVENECLPGEPPACEDDGEWCTGEEFCDEDAGECGHQNVPECGDDGLFCNGGAYCDEETDSCSERDVPECPDDGMFCNGEEACDEDAQGCAHIDPVFCPSDGAYCNGTEVCDEETLSCVNGEPVECEDNGVFCDGPEICSDEAGECISAGTPCAGDEKCEEDEDRCVSPKVTPPDPGWPVGEITGGCCSC